MSLIILYNYKKINKLNYYGLRYISSLQTRNDQATSFLFVYILAK